MAYVDESAHTKLDGGCYILAAAMLAPEDRGDVRDSMRSLAPSQGQRFHWRLESDSGRRKATALVADLPVLHLVVVGTRLDRRKQERARRRCLSCLLYELDIHGVDRVFLESRTPTLNKADIDAVTFFKNSGVVDRGVRVEHDYPLEEPLLWIADLVAGACGQSVVGVDEYRRELAQLIIEHAVDLQTG